jgi:hypothetical protein
MCSNDERHVSQGSRDGIDGLTLTFKTAMGINQEYRLPGRLNLTAAIAKFAFCP